VESVLPSGIEAVVVDACWHEFSQYGHVSGLFASCSSMLYALRSHGLPDQSLKDVFHATAVDCEVNVLCASVARVLFGCRLRATWLISAPLCIGYAGHSTTVAGMFLEADDALFRKIRCNKAHVLHSDRPEIVYSLRTRTSTYNKSLICKISDLNERHFFRCLYKDCYWLFYRSFYIFLYIVIYM